jgi:alkylation response protein AidB-like acyl-CoA dehydrogenase
VGEDGRARGADSAAIRAELLDAIRRRRPEFEAAGERAEELRTLPPDVFATLREMGVFWLKTPAELGGTPLAPLDFCDVMEEFAYADTATAWIVMVGNGGTGTAGGCCRTPGRAGSSRPAARCRSSSGRRGRAAPDGRWLAASW